MKKSTTIFVRSFSVLLMIFAIAFGVTWRKTDFSLGDEILTGIGLNAWSNVTEGTHYAAVYALIMLCVAVYLFALTTNNKQQTIKKIYCGGLGVLVVFNLLSGLFW